MPEKNRQHYVPKFYLRNFSDNERAIDTFNLTNSKYIKNASIKDMCQKHNFYGADNKVENFLADVESEASSIIKNVLKTDDFPEVLKDYIHLFEFILISEARNLKIAETNNYFADFLLKQMLEHHPDAKDIDLNELKIELNEPATTPIASAIEGTKLILDLEPLLIIEKTGGTRSFITSDNPMIRYNSFYLHKRYPGGYGYMDRGAQFFFPISPSKCILLYDFNAYDIPGKQGNILYLNRARDVDQLNELFFLNAYNNVFFNQRVRKDYIEGLQYKCRREPRLNDIGREVQTLGSAGPRGGQVFQFGHNHVRKLFNFPWLKLSSFANRLAVPDHMGGIQRTESQYISDKVEERRLEFANQRPFTM
ncbi:DUF4238 domain-containing protein [Paenibacillus sp. Y412MC10]|uniref:DUF4238 domain-containing protein n=1 Tax=Geobacillus sp. (strain Y412MC10) TaxID=481743 RepID=UPI0011A9DACA|nr:DUF4238 domain-containing protein [Paenibacillus sp. Y412MC10]